MNIKYIDFNDPHYPSALKKHLAADVPKTINAIGNPDILQNKTLAIFNSIKCPGKIIIKTYEYIRQLRESNITVIGGFHSPLEQECLNILLKGKQPVILCPARSIETMRIKKEFKKPIDEGGFLILSPFSFNHNRISSGRADKRNHFAAAIADKIVIPYAAPGSKTESLCNEWIKKGKTVFTFNSDYNKNLLDLGVGVEVIKKDRYD
ncbi:MAG TPA: hypothetical protein ENG83_04480 [Nitrospirae bacterium]|nr:DNA recombination-mediator protein A [bacterium BMS3Abin06]HDH11447.1 hypothetical protein [Nitrospirota bacterium]HDZ01399.1 hypothetical protein [Nitrospirota bacterium]